MKAYRRQKATDGRGGVGGGGGGGGGGEGGTPTSDDEKMEIESANFLQKYLVTKGGYVCTHAKTKCTKKKYLGTIGGCLYTSKKTNFRNIL